jgi:hypothetical protein
MGIPISGVARAPASWRLSGAAGFTPRIFADRLKQMAGIEYGVSADRAPTGIEI